MRRENTMRDNTEAIRSENPVRWFVDHPASRPVDKSSEGANRTCRVGGTGEGRHRAQTLSASS
jgi:hypothetical protein